MTLLLIIGAVLVSSPSILVVRGPPRRGAAWPRPSVALVEAMT